MGLKKGLGMVSLRWSDGNRLIGVKRCVVGCGKSRNMMGGVKEFDKRRVGGKRGKVGERKGGEGMMGLVESGVSVGVNGEYVVFDWWF